MITSFYLVSLGPINRIGDPNNTTLDNNIRKSVCGLRDHDYCIVEEQGDSSDPTDGLAINWNMLRKQMIGLTNHDHKTCYINSALQCLANTPPLVDWLFSQLDKLNTCK